MNPSPGTCITLLNNNSNLYIFKSQNFKIRLIHSPDKKGDLNEEGILSLTILVIRNYSKKLLKAHKQQDMIYYLGYKMILIIKKQCTSIDESRRASYKLEKMVPFYHNLSR